jgi:hypothetical protein
VSAVISYLGGISGGIFQETIERDVCVEEFTQHQSSLFLVEGGRYSLRD